MNSQTALQVTDFNFYGDDLIALKDNATGEIYTAINSVLKGIGFTDRDQIRKRRDKWINDSVISKGIFIFNIPTTKKDTPMNYQEVYCISQHKLPIALAKINITPKMKQTQPELASKLELYQDKCADVLASVFIDHKTPTDTNIQPLVDAITTLTQTVTTMQQDISSLKQQSAPKKLPEKKYSRWKTTTFDKLRLLTEYVNEHSDQNLTLADTLHITINEMQDAYNIELSDYTRDYMLENGSERKPYDLDVINFYKDIRSMYTLTVNSIMDKLNLSTVPSTRNIFDELAENIVS